MVQRMHLVGGIARQRRRFPLVRVEKPGAVDIGSSLGHIAIGVWQRKGRSECPYGPMGCRGPRQRRARVRRLLHVVEHGDDDGAADGNGKVVHSQQGHEGMVSSQEQTRSCL